MADPPPPRFPWLVAAALFAAALAAGCWIAPEALATKEAPASRLDALRWALACAAPVALLLAAFHPRALPALRAWSPGQLSLAAGLLAGWVTLVPALRLDPYVPAIAIAAAAACPAALRAREQSALGADGLVVWLLLWIPLDLRWFDPGKARHPLWLGTPQESYAPFILAISAVAVLAFGGSGRGGDLGFRPPPGLPRALGRLGLALLGFALLAIPIGLATGFLRRTDAQLDQVQALVRGVGIFLTVALPEELFFRGILDRGLAARWGGAPALAISSLAFGLMHWNNRRELDDQAVYVALATVAGVLYALAARTAGLGAAAVVHAAVDLVWQVWLKK